VSGLSDVAQITAGTLHACALVKTSGQVLCWGFNNFRELGNGSNGAKAKPTPVAIPGIFSSKPLNGASFIATNDRRTCAVLAADGSAFCWGGDDSKASEPKRVDGLSGARAIALGRDHACALGARDVSCWGGNDNGQLGDGTRERHDTPKPIVP
jgi:alpha-tubulin suppressor-like RCC1 family protein